MLYVNIALLVIYNAVNIYFDVRWRITKNLWHLLYLLVFIGLIVFQYTTSIWWSLGWGMIGSLVYGLLLEKVGSTAPGDTKMIMVNALGMCAYILQVNQAFIGADMRNGLLLLLGSLSLILFMIDVYRFSRKYGLRNFFRSMVAVMGKIILPHVGLGHLAKSVDLESKDMRVLPGAVMIAAAVFVTTIVFFPYVD